MWGSNSKYQIFLKKKKKKKTPNTKYHKIKVKVPLDWDSNPKW